MFKASVNILQCPLENILSSISMLAFPASCHKSSEHDTFFLVMLMMIFEIMIFVRNWLEFQSLLNACQSVAWKYCYKLDFVIVYTATLNCHGTFDILEIGAEIEYAMLSKLVCNVLNSFTRMAKCILMCA